MRSFLMSRFGLMSLSLLLGFITACGGSDTGTSANPPTDGVEETAGAVEETQSSTIPDGFEEVTYAGETLILPVGLFDLIPEELKALTMEEIKELETDALIVATAAANPQVAKRVDSKDYWIFSDYSYQQSALQGFVRYRFLPSRDQLLEGTGTTVTLEDGTVLPAALGVNASVGAYYLTDNEESHFGITETGADCSKAETLFFGGNLRIHKAQATSGDGYVESGMPFDVCVITEQASGEPVAAVIAQDGKKTAEEIGVTFGVDRILTQPAR